jgi:hypothetical protein
MTMLLPYLQKNPPLRLKAQIVEISATYPLCGTILIGGSTVIFGYLAVQLTNAIVIV